MKKLDRTFEKMCSRKWWLCWKVSVQCVREIHFFHSDIAVIIIHCQNLILYSWRSYLSITPRNMRLLSVSLYQWRCVGTHLRWKFLLNKKTTVIQRSPDESVSSLEICTYTKWVSDGVKSIQAIFRHAL
jgi:hypothetical protein